MKDRMRVQELERTNAKFIERLGKVEYALRISSEAKPTVFEELDHKI